MAAIAGHYDYWNKTSEEAFLKEWLRVEKCEDYIRNYCCPSDCHVSHHCVWKFISCLISLERSSEETLVVAFKSYYPIHGDCRSSGWFGSMSINKFVGFVYFSEQSNIWNFNFSFVFCLN